MGCETTIDLRPWITNTVEDRRPVRGQGYLVHGCGVRVTPLLRVP